MDPTALTRERLKDIRRGIEKESLRVRPDGTLSQQLHPPALGAALTHPHITTDFSESQLELITAPHRSADACLAELEEIHQTVYRHIGEEILWAASMPCNLPADNLIPIGRYGTSNVGRAKTVYRIGLSHRYGRRMQAISGIHYNFSLPGVTSEQYFALIRNFRRHSWLPIYLFGASPAACASFVEGRRHPLAELAPGTMYAPHATSLRMGPLGYQSDAQASLCVSYNSLDSYTNSLYDALTRPYPAYEQLGVMTKSGNGDDYRQLSTTLLQIENEFYGTIRPKRRIRRGERPLHALRERGVEYVEVRLMDLDPFVALGITPLTMRFLDVFLLHCLMSPSAQDTPQEIGGIARNQHAVALRGREKGLLLYKGIFQVPLQEWGHAILKGCEPIAEALDAAAGGASAHREALEEAARRLDDPDITPSARVLHAMARNHGNSFLRFVLIESTLHKASLATRELSPEAIARFEALAAKSLAEQRALEAADKVDFETFRRQYLSHELLTV